MSKPLGPYHYEYVKGRKKGHEWRVGDQDDDMVTDFPNEAAARKYVEDHNREVEEILKTPVFRKKK